MPNSFPERELIELSCAFTGSIVFNHTHCYIVSTLHGEGAPFVTYPNELTFRKAIANRNLEKGISFKSRKIDLTKLGFHHFMSSSMSDETIEKLSKSV